MRNKEYLNILNNSPIPCILFSIEEDNSRQINTIQVLGTNKKFIEKTNNRDNKKIIDLHNGSVSVKSEKHVGSEFTVKIPLSMCDSSELDKKTFTYNRYVDNIDIEFSDIYEVAK